MHGLTPVTPTSQPTTACTTLATRSRTEPAQHLPGGMKTPSQGWPPASCSQPAATARRPANAQSPPLSPAPCSFAPLAQLAKLTGSEATTSSTNPRGNAGIAPEKTLARGVLAPSAPVVPAAPPRRLAFGGINAGRDGRVLCTANGRRGGDLVGDEGEVGDVLRFPAASHSRRQRVASPLLVSERVAASSSHRPGQTGQAIATHLPAAISNTFNARSPPYAAPSASHHRVMNVHTTCRGVSCWRKAHLPSGCRGRTGCGTSLRPFCSTAGVSDHVQRAKGGGGVAGHHTRVGASSGEGAGMAMRRRRLRRRTTHLVHAMLGIVVPHRMRQVTVHCLRCHRVVVSLSLAACAVSTVVLVVVVVDNVSVPAPLDVLRNLVTTSTLR